MVGLFLVCCLCALLSGVSLRLGDPVGTIIFAFAGGLTWHALEQANRGRVWW